MPLQKNQEDFSFSNSIVSIASNIHFAATLSHDSDHPGATMYLAAELKNFDTPITDAKVSAKVTLPDGSTMDISYEKAQPGHFKYDYKTTIPGLYTFHVHAKGNTPNGVHFTREHTLSGGVYYGD
jgi:Cu/Zn superoxide dismutase